jgi:hypothetical protein
LIYPIDLFISDLFGTYFWTYGLYTSWNGWEWDVAVPSAFTFTAWDENANEPNDYLSDDNIGCFFDPLYGWYDGSFTEILRCVCEVV